MINYYCAGSKQIKSNNELPSVGNPTFIFHYLFAIFTPSDYNIPDRRPSDSVGNGEYVCDGCVDEFRFCGDKWEFGGD